MSTKKKFITSIIFPILTLPLVGFFIFSGLFIVWAIFLPAPDFNSFEERVVAQSTRIYDRNGKVILYNVHNNIKRTIISITDAPINIKNATIAIEDQNFYKHIGIEPVSILRAFIVNFTTGTVQQGGSTITQQVVKNTLLTQDKKLSRKLKEVVLALKVERVMPKEKILELYLNETPYGGNIYGIEEAAKTYFGKSAKDLNLAESAYLAALPQAPTFLSPYGNHKDRLESRKNSVLTRMRGQNLISKEELVAAKDTKVIFLKPEEKNIKAPHFVFFILDQLKQKYGEEVLNNGGLQVTTSLDWEMQQQAEETVDRFGKENIKKFNASNAGLIALDPKTGQILSMVGSIDYFDIENEGNFNVTLAKRQPGSSFKPIVYAAALEKGYTPETVVFDLPTEFSTTCTPDSRPKTADATCYSPVNYDDIFVGPITFKEALAQSRNIPAVKVLYLTGLDRVIKLAKNLGITTLTDPKRYGLTLVLGGGEVTLLEMASAYGVFAAEGVRHPVVGILEIKDSKGNVLETYTESSGSAVLNPNTARQISDILSDNIARTPVFGPNSLLHVPNHAVAAKTGTTNDYRDAWIIGYTPSIVVGAWVGNNDNSPMERKVAGMIVVPMWNAFLTDYLNNKTNEPFTAPLPTPKDLKPTLRGYWRGGLNYFIDSISGKLATEYTPEELKEEKVVTQIHSILYWVDKNNPRGPKPDNPHNDPQFILWETPVINWALSRGINNETESVIPNQKDDIHLPGQAPKINLSLVKEKYLETETVKIEVYSGGGSKITQADFFVNDVYLGTVKDAPYTFSFTPQDLGLNQELNSIRVVGYDAVKNKGEATKNFFIEF